MTDDKAALVAKPHKGKISDWYKVECSHGLGYYIMGQFHDHPDFGSKFTNTSWVEKHDLQTGEIETRNSRYTLIGPDTTVAKPKTALLPAQRGEGGVDDVEAVTLRACPPGLFRFRGTLGFKSEYKTESKSYPNFWQSDAYVVESGEYFWGASSDPKVRENLLVTPIAIAALPRSTEGMCSDCPPVGYQTDETRCLPCPRRSAAPAAGAERSGEEDNIKALAMRIARRRGLSGRAAEHYARAMLSAAPAAGAERSGEDTK